VAWTGTASVARPDADDDETTALAIPTDPTDRFEPAPDPHQVEASRTPRPPAAERRPERGVPLITVAVVTFLVTAAVVAAAFALRSPVRPPLGSPGASPSLPAIAASSPPAASPSPVPSASPSPRPSVDPAIAALDAVDGAIAAARGGHDGLKGKEANDLESLAGRVRTALADGDRTRALSVARDLDRRVRDVADHLGQDAGDRLRGASAALVDALGG
jgi:hypothetical protein